MRRTAITFLGGVGAVWLALALLLGTAGTANATERVPDRVAGLTPHQTWMAQVIVGEAHKRDMPKRAAVVGIAVALQESRLHNLGNPTYPATIKDDRTWSRGYDHDSVGVFQQRPKSGWGHPMKLIDPAIAANKFYNALERVRGWQNMPVTRAGQAVQNSAYPNAYAKHHGKAKKIVNELWGYYG